jgi:hypothetical protein
MRHPALVSMATVLFMGLLSAAAAAGPATGDDARVLAERIDARIAARWRDENVKPAAPADDAAYLRRVYLDLVGQAPAVTEVRDFLDDPDPDKRAQLVESLLKTDAHARHLASAWRRILLPRGTTATATTIEPWLQQKFRANAPYDRMAREVLTAVPSDPGLSSFYQALENKPENLAAAASRIFLGVRLECAQCHNHPTASWKRQQFWEFAAFFSEIRPPGQAAANRPGELTIPNTTKVVRARLLLSDTPALAAGKDPREILAAWITRADNPFFARAAVNRVWAHFFGVGLIEPLESLGEDSAASHPELLDELARAFAASKFDLRFLTRAITASKAYGLSSEVSAPGQDRPRLFARAAVRGLTAEQLYDSLGVVIGRKASLDRNPAAAAAAFGARAEFVARFDSPDSPVEAHTSILQALHLMNGKPTADATSLQGNHHLRSIAEARGRTSAERIEELYLLTLARKPRPDELAHLAKYVESGGPRGDRALALTDVFWALLNSSEFALNH